METVEETGRRRRSTTIIYQFRILMSERLIQKASTLRKPKRSTLLSLPEGWLPSPVFLLLASDTLCYSRMISEWPPPRLLFCPFAYCLFICSSSSCFFFTIPSFIPFVCCTLFFHRVNISIATLRVSFFLKFSASSCARLCSLSLDIDLFFLASLSHISNLLSSISIH